jgi:hypothetical protein
LRLARRIERLEARVPKGKKRVILVWIGADGKTTKVADTDPHVRNERYGNGADGVGLRTQIGFASVPELGTILLTSIGLTT